VVDDILGGTMTELIFSYGTLQLEAVQLSTFGRLLSASADTLGGYRIEMLEITDPDVIATSGLRIHPILLRSGHETDAVHGTVLEVTEDELAAADSYEVEDYQRVQVLLASGRSAWVYEARPYDEDRA
jgi:gamma-glutamylcyclotransferase (GGCT)/AIG2-like uncharacterized protein YtfP